MKHSLQLLKVNKEGTLLEFNVFPSKKGKNTGTISDAALAVFVGGCETTIWSSEVYVLSKVDWWWNILLSEMSPSNAWEEGTQGQKVVGKVGFFEDKIQERRVGAHWREMCRICQLKCEYKEAI